MKMSAIVLLVSSLKILSRRLVSVGDDTDCHPSQAGRFHHRLDRLNPQVGDGLVCSELVQGQAEAIL